MNAKEIQLIKIHLYNVEGHPGASIEWYYKGENFPAASAIVKKEDVTGLIDNLVRAHLAGIKESKT